MAKKETIAVDVDDTLADHAEAFLNWSNKRYGTRLTVEDYNDHWSEMWKIDQKQTEERAEEFHTTGEHGRFATKPDSREVLVYLKEHYNLVIVTARRKAVVKESLEWIDSYYGDIFSDVRFVPIWEKGNTITKADICRELNAQYLIDDLMRHCRLAAEAGLEALLFGDYSWSRHEDPVKNVYRVKDWQAVKGYFDAKIRQ